ncbi:MAG: hypothetical protein IJZ08_07550 [Clostridia bacterium]|nr:hypothetical protein [Clostridia bacterium]
MICKIADLTVDVPAAGGISPRFTEYLCEFRGQTDITIHADAYRRAKYPGAPEELIAYIESGVQFHRELLRFDGMMLHSSAVVLDGRAYLFSGPCGVGKSTHTRLWKEVFGSDAQIINDDKPTLRRLNGTWIAYGTPWCGKDGINVNRKVPLAGICFLKQSPETRIRRLESPETTASVILQTMHRFKDEDNLTRMLAHVDKLVREIPIFELENRPVAEAARLSFETMHRAAKEAGL